MKIRIRYGMNDRTYLQAIPAMGLPMFGGTKEQAMVFETREDAIDAVKCFPFHVMWDLEEEEGE